MKRPPLACSWSGGKDSCLALHMLSDRFEPKALLTVFDEHGKRSRSHGLRPAVLQAQADAMGLPLQRASASWQTYEEQFVHALEVLGRQGIHDIAFGDIDLAEHRAWEERVCARADAAAHLPLWLQERRSVLESFWRSGHRCRIVAVDGAKLGERFLGVELTPSVAGELETLGVDACGENGEFHTVVVDGPRFRQPLELEAGEAVERAGYLAIDLF